MSHKDGRVVLSAWVEPVLRDYVREAARLSGLEFSRWIARAVRQTMARESADRAHLTAPAPRQSQPRPRRKSTRRGKRPRAASARPGRGTRK